MRHTPADGKERAALTSPLLASSLALLLSTLRAHMHPQNQQPMSTDKGSVAPPFQLLRLYAHDNLRPTLSPLSDVSEWWEEPARPNKQALVRHEQELRKASSAQDQAQDDCPPAKSPTSPMEAFVAAKTPPSLETVHEESPTPSPMVSPQLSPKSDILDWLMESSPPTTGSGKRRNSDPSSAASTDAIIYHHDTKRLRAASSVDSYHIPTDMPTVTTIDVLTAQWKCAKEALDTVLQESPLCKNPASAAKVVDPLLTACIKLTRNTSAFLLAAEHNQNVEVHAPTTGDLNMLAMACLFQAVRLQDKPSFGVGLDQLEGMMESVLLQLATSEWKQVNKLQDLEEVWVALSTTFDGLQQEVRNNHRAHMGGFALIQDMLLQDVVGEQQKVRNNNRNQLGRVDASIEKYAFLMMLIFAVVDRWVVQVAVQGSPLQIWTGSFAVVAIAVAIWYRYIL
jgi:hypothetical protein